MKAKTRTPQKLLTLAASRWTAYATASAATVFGASTNAEAATHYSGLVNSEFSEHSGTLQRSFPLEHHAALLFRQRASSQGFLDYASFEVIGRGGAFRGRPAHQIAFRAYVEKLHIGEVVSQASFGGAGVFGALAQATTYANPFSQWTKRGEGFIGFKFDAGAGPQYGWARVKVSGQPLNYFTVVDYAWGDIGDVIITQKPSREQPTVETPPSGSLGLLALGAAGLTAWRERRLRLPK